MRFVTRRVAVLGALFLAGAAIVSAAQAVPTPPIASNAELLATLPVSRAVSGVFAETGPYFYVSGFDGIRVLDTSDPALPVPIGVLAGAIYENERMSYGERVDASGRVVKRLLLVGVEIAGTLVSPTRVVKPLGPGNAILVVDVTDPRDPHEVGRTPASGSGAMTTGTHTVACVTLACDTAYSIGSGNGTFSVVDLSDPTAPRQVGTVASPAIKKNAAYAGGYGHQWSFDRGLRIGWHVGTTGAAAFDVRDPRKPVLLQATNAQASVPPYNSLIWHGSQRPNGAAFERDLPPALANGNILLVGEEDIDEPDCAAAGAFQTWYVPDLDGVKFRKLNPTGLAGKGSIVPLDTWTVAESTHTLSGVRGAICSAHWFDAHESGIVAVAYYQQGVRLLDVRNPRDIREYGWWTPLGTETWDAYFVPVRNAAGRRTDKRSDIVYTVDAARGVDVLRVTLPPAPRG